MAFNGAGVRDTARTLKIGINTVIRTLKNSPPKRIKRLRPLRKNIHPTD
ncbi:Transposase [Shigella dysenteriae 1617]|uniref:Transposase n=1 Tax=Shigella dysenteriae 1617 TaxID=754093 RepID=A0A0A7A095_SHIDY|nr:Transposase [Shigella dysenteriae 1617]